MLTAIFENVKYIKGMVTTIIKLNLKKKSNKTNWIKWIIQFQLEANWSETFFQFNNIHAYILQKGFLSAVILESYCHFNTRNTVFEQAEI